ncbi:MAG: hypothetical protein GDA46_03000 [Bdellovibrionales bacterium]|nr:hypothetical protein [Bdellovibrionales bacterium]
MEGLFLNSNSSKYEKSFKFHGFIPCDELKKTSQKLYDLIESRSPSDSKNQFVLIKKGNTYEAYLKVTSASSCCFEIYSKKRKALNSIHSIQEKFLNKILDWNQNRNTRLLL